MPIDPVLPHDLDDLYGPGAEDAEMGETIPPQWICMTCKTVVGPIVDDDEHRCKCDDVYLIDLWLVAPVAANTTST